MFGDPFAPVRPMIDAATAAALEAARVEAYSSIVQNIMCAIFGLLLLAVSRWLWLRASKIQDSFDRQSVFVLSGALACGGALLVFIGLACLTDPWIWVTLQNPEPYVAKKVLGL
ncbi:hypothetical protein [Brucella intermedia]|uniref:hypothetical protein n=1 Tax=Brucella intermedia TaxID=94625 RepID=UPI00158FC6CA|nr:hypothetical protein [Brucella intermedia]